MYVMIFDTHDIDIVKERVVANLMSMGYSWNRGTIEGTERYFFAYELGNNGYNGDRVTHGDHYDTPLHHEAEVRAHDCLWMEADPEPVETVTSAALPVYSGWTTPWTSST